MDFNQYITQPQPYQFISEDQYAQPESASYDTLVSKIMTRQHQSQR